MDYSRVAAAAYDFQDMGLAADWERVFDPGGHFRTMETKSGSYGAETTRVWTRKQADRVVFRGGR